MLKTYKVELPKYIDMIFLNLLISLFILLEKAATVGFPWNPVMHLNSTNFKKL